MSRYQLNKAMRQVGMSDDPGPRQRYLDDPAGFARDFDFSDEEREAFVAGQVGRLYALGVQPFVLLFFAQVAYRANVQGADGLVEFMKRYRQDVAPYGNPDFET